MQGCYTYRVDSKVFYINNYKLNIIMKLKHFLCSVVICFISFVSLKAQTNATFTVTIPQDWGTGYIANVTVIPNVNITTWVVVMDIQGHLATTSDFLWNAIYTNNGTQYTFTPTSGNAIVAANASVSFGFKVDNITASTPRINSSSIVNANATSTATNLPVVLSAYWSNTGQNIFTNSTYTGNVGIGTTTPFSKFSFGTSSAAFNSVASKFALYENANGTYFYGIGGYLDNQNVDATAGLGLWGGTENNTTWNGTAGVKPHLFILRNSGNVGIGKTAPIEKLDVAGNILFNYSGYIGNSGVTYNPIIKTGWENNKDFVGFYTSGSGVENANEKMRLLNNGNFGIGTSIPQSLLHVGGSTSSQISLGTTTYPGTTGQALAAIQVDQGSTNGGILNFKVNPWNQSSDGVFTPITRMTINQYGNVGIGTSTPTAKLSVANSTGVASLNLQQGTNNPFWITSQNNGLQIGGNGATQPVTGAINIDQTGNVSFTNPLNFATGKLTINNLPIVGSQWNTTGTNINYSAGNVGIGTATPSANLSIANATGTAALNLTDGNNEPVWISSNSGTLQIGGSGTSKPSNGVINVGNSNIVFNKRSIFVNNGVEVSNYSSGQTSLYVSTDENVFSANTSKETGDAFYLHTDKANGMDVETSSGDYAIQGENYGGKIGLSGFSANGDVSTSIGVSGESIKGFGVYGRSHSSDGAGVKGEGEQDGVLGTSWNVGVHGITTAMGKAIMGETSWDPESIENYVPLNTVTGEYSGFFKRGDFAIYGNNEDNGVEPDFLVTRGGFIGLGGSQGILSKMHFFGQGAASGLTFFSNSAHNENEYRQFQDGKNMYFTRGDGTLLKGYVMNEKGDVNFSGAISSTKLRVGLTDDPNASPIIFSNSDGQVGIGTSTIPTDAKLSVNGPIYATEFKTLGASTSTSFVGGTFRISTSEDINSNSTLFANTSGQIGINSETIPSDCKLFVNGGLASNTLKSINNIDSLFTGQFIGGKFVIAQGDAESTTPTFFANSGGQIGVNTSIIPKNFAMAVNGKVIATEITIKNYDKWPVPDYVFDKDYKLRSLQSLKSYINENKHLPEVSSAKEIEKSGGMNIGEMQTILLKKVEELTLYILKQQEEIDALKKEVNKNK